MNILITGASGFIGTNLVNKLKVEHNIIGQVRTEKRAENNVQYHALDIDGQSKWKSSLSNIHTVIHLAAVAHNKSDNLNYINEVNINGTRNLAEQAIESGVKRFIFISSIGVLGNKTSKDYFSEDSPLAPHSLYVKSKVKAERLLLDLTKKNDLELVIIRPVLVYGVGAPGNFDRLVNLISKVPALPFGLCKNKRSFISIDNLVNFISICVSHPKAKNEIFCVADGVDLSIREFTDAIANGLGKHLIQLPVPVSILNSLGKLTGRVEQIEQLVGNLQVDIKKSRELLKWNPPFTMEDTLKKLASISN